MQNSSKSSKRYIIFIVLGFLLILCILLAFGLYVYSYRHAYFEKQRDELYVSDIPISETYQYMDEYDVYNYDVECFAILLDLNNIKFSNSMLQLLDQKISNLDNIDDKINVIVDTTIYRFNSKNIKIEVLENYPFEYLPTPCLVWLQKDYYGINNHMYPSIVIKITDETVYMIDPVLGNTDWKLNYIRSQYNQAGRHMLHITVK